MKKEKKIRLSEAQKDVLRYLKRGCPMLSTVMGNTVIKYGGFTIGVKANTKWGLISKGLVTHSKQGLAAYELTELGKKISEEL